MTSTLSNCSSGLSRDTGQQVAEHGPEAEARCQRHGDDAGHEEQECQ